MIVPMSKVYVVVAAPDQQALMENLRHLAVLHLTPVDPRQALPDEKTLAQIDRLQRAIQILHQQEPAGPPPDLTPLDITAETLQIQQTTAELSHQLVSLHQQMEKLTLWGDLRLEQVEALRQAGLEVKFLSIPAEQAGQITAECVQPLADLPGKRILLAIIDRRQDITVPDSAQWLPLPAKDRHTLRAQAAQIDQSLREYQNRLAQLAHGTPALQEELDRQQEAAELSKAVKGAFAQDRLFALQGWIPAEKAENLAAQLDAAGIKSAVRILPPDPEETPPTLIHYPAWCRPIKGLFDILGTLPGYKELDLAPFFMVALPVFAAMLIGDAGYGLVFMLPPLLWYRKMVAAAGKSKTHLLLVIGIVTLVWGILSANYFGLSPDNVALAGGYFQTVDGRNVPDHAAMQAATGFWASLGKIMIAVAPIWNADSEAARNLLMKLSLLFGCIHISLAHLRQFFALVPHPRCLAEIGWCIFIWAMLGVIWLLFFGLKGLPVPVSLVYAGLIIGFVLFLLFTTSHKNPVKRIGVGFASSLLPMLGTFSDTMSYIRLMAVGLASYYIAAAFNSLGASVAPAATWFAAAPILIFGHLLNIALCIIAVFAHGVRLNMLEFSNNAGIQWAGYAYQPFAGKQPLTDQ